MVASDLVVLETRSGITGGVSAAAESADRMDATSAAFGSPFVDAILGGALSGVN
jgi:hypothetical protein